MMAKKKQRKGKKRKAKKVKRYKFPKTMYVAHDGVFGPTHTECNWVLANLLSYHKKRIAIYKFESEAERSRPPELTLAEAKGIISQQKRTIARLMAKRGGEGGQK